MRVFKKIAVLTSRKSWFIPYAEDFVQRLKRKRFRVDLYFNHRKIMKEYEIVFILSYFNIVDKIFLSKHNHNLVVHESALPKGRGWAPLFWQIFEGKNRIPIVLFKADKDIDKGDIYIRDVLKFEGHETYDEIRKKQAEKTMELCLRFIDNCDNLKPKRQKGRASFYKKRTPADSKLDINKSLKEQFNLLRIVNNNEFPAFFDYKGNRYILKIFKEENIGENKK